jgi:hypothetical protein
MIELIVSGAFIAIIAMAVTEFTKQIPYKPFNCSMCMVWWCSLAFALLHFTTVDAVVFIGAAILTRQTLWKIWPTMF